jgi:hypothetical protein
MRFGEYLLMHGIISHEQLEKALGYQVEGGFLLGESLVSLGFVSAEEIDRYLQEHLLIQADDIVRDHRSELSAK